MKFTAFRPRNPQKMRLKKQKKKQNKKAKTKEYIFKTSNFNILRLILERGQVEDE